MNSRYTIVRCRLNLPTQITNGEFLCNYFTCTASVCLGQDPLRQSSLEAKTVTLSEIIARASGILLSGRHVPFFKSPLHGPNTQRSHVRQRAKVAISNNSLWSLETHSKSLKTSVVYTTSCFEALVHQTLEKEGFWASFLINFPYVNWRMIFQKSDTILSTSWIIAAATA